MRIIALLTFLTFSLTRLAAQPVASEEADVRRDRLVATQNEVRALVAKSEGHPPPSDYYSAALETPDPLLLEAQMAFERGVVSELKNQTAEAREQWATALRLLESGSKEAKQWLRRANAAIVQQELIDLDYKNDAVFVARLLSEAREMADRNSLPDLGSIPTRQLLVEHWVFSSELMFRFANWLPNGPKASQLAEAKRVLEEICQHRLLTEKLSAGKPTPDHEAVIDQAVFEKRMPALFASLFRHVKLAGEGLPESTRATWTALLAVWATEGPDDGLSTKAWGDGDFSKSFQVERFQALASLISVLNRFEFPETAKKLSKGVAVLDASAVPPGEAIFPELLIDGGQLEAASAFLGAAETTGPSDTTKILRLRLLYAQRKNLDAATLADGWPNRPPESFFWQGKALLALDRQSEARKAFREFVELSPESHLAPEACLLSAMLSSNLHESNLASAYYEETMARYPNSKEARRASELLEE